MKLKMTMMVLKLRVIKEVKEFIKGFKHGFNNGYEKAMLKRINK